MKIFINQDHNLLPDCAFGLYVCCENCMSGFSACVLNMSKSAIFLFRSMPNGNWLFSTASLSLVNNSLVHELGVMAAVVLHVNATYDTHHSAQKLVYEKGQSVMGGKLFPSYTGRSAKIKTFDQGISEWTYFFNLAKPFQRYLNFSAPKSVFLDKTQRKVRYLEWHQKDFF